MSSVILSIRDVSKIYRNSQGQIINALKRVSLDIYEGEILGLLGVNGAGKTTLSSIISTLHPATTGEIIWQGKPQKDYIEQFRRNLGFCSQYASFEPSLSVYDHLLFAGRYYGMNSRDIAQRISELLTMFNLTSYAYSSPAILSGGYKQRLMIARAMIHRPSVIILDEPTVALDPHVRNQLWQVIKSLKQEGVTVILTTHYLDEAEMLSDRVCILDKGIVRLIDTPANLMTLYTKDNLEEVFLHILNESH